MFRPAPSHLQRWTQKFQPPPPIPLFLPLFDSQGVKIAKMTYISVDRHRAFCNNFVFKKWRVKELTEHLRKNVSTIIEFKGGSWVANPQRPRTAVCISSVIFIWEKFPSFHYFSTHRPPGSPNCVWLICRCCVRSIIVAVDRCRKKYIVCSFSVARWSEHLARGK